jgi:hypothetical protein
MMQYISNGRRKECSRRSADVLWYCQDLNEWLCNTTQAKSMCFVFKTKLMLSSGSKHNPESTRFDPASWNIYIRARSFETFLFFSMNYTCFARNNLLIISSRNSVKIGSIWYACFVMGENDTCHVPVHKTSCSATGPQSSIYWPVNNKMGAIRMRVIHEVSKFIFSTFYY